jgi:hypothetical protein
MGKNTFFKIFVLALCAGALMVTPAHAQFAGPGSTDAWQFSAALYLWGAGVGGETRSGSDIEVEFDDIVDDLEMAFMGTFQARKGKWGLLTDVIYLDLSGDDTVNATVPVGPSQIDVTTRADLNMTGWVLHFAGAYNLLSKGMSSLDLLGGVRYLDIDMDLDASLDALGPGRARTLSESENVWDGIVGVTGNISLSNRWYIPYYVDIGTGESDFTWQAVGGIGFRVAKWVDLALVYRYLSWDFDSDIVIDDLDFSGPAFGAIFRF